MADRIIAMWRPTRDVEQYLREEMARLSAALRECPCPDCTDLFLRFINAIWRHRRRA